MRRVATLSAFRLRGSIVAAVPFTFALLAGTASACRPQPRHSVDSSCVNTLSSLRNMSSTIEVFCAEQRGSLYSDDYRLFFTNAEGVVISPFHDIPLYHDEERKIFNMVVEVPRWSNAKMEINLKEKLNPIKQDYKKGKLRFVANCFPHKGYIWNYGALPQTWEDPEHIDASTKCKGDGDPIDVCEIGQKVHKRGDVVQVKVLGTVALIDDGETDWKMLAIDVTDPLADKLNDIADIEKHMPGFIAATVEWFKIYKMPDGNPPNKFAFDGKAQNREFALKVVDETHVAWKQLMARPSDPEGLSRACTQVDATAAKISADDARRAVDAAAPRNQDTRTDDAVDKWHYIKL